MQNGFYDADACELSDFEALTSSDVDMGRLSNAYDIVDKVPVYEVDDFINKLDDNDFRRELMAEWAYILSDGPGVLALKNALRNHDAINQATEIFHQIITEEKQGNTGADHFATAGNNDRIWNSLQKLCFKAPNVFAQYFANPAIDAVCEAWLGPNYQVTAQVNLVRPGGKAQTCHRDYHLGFQTAESCARYPAHVHQLSPLMTLQGGFAHCDMPIESGPTKLLPFSQKYAPGYAAWRREDFQTHFEENYVQLPLKKGDAIFFNPALFHAAGENKSADIERLVNLVQVGSAMGRTLENLDRIGMCMRLYPVMKSLKQTSLFSQAEINAIIAACAEGYPFPTNLDTDPPVGGLAPASQAEIFHKALNENLQTDSFIELLDEQQIKQRP